MHNGSIRSATVGALPIIDHFLQRLNLESFLHTYVPANDSRLKLPPAQGLLLLVKNLLISREPIYGLGEWAARYHHQFLGLTPAQLLLINDDRCGRCLSRYFKADRSSLLLDLIRHVVHEFQVGLDELHNDSTTISFYGAYPDANVEKQRGLQRTPAITWGHSKAHRPDLKQLLYILTISDDGGVPIHVRTASGNVTDDTTHCDNWELLCQIADRRDFLYVADCKLATMKNMNYITANGGRFVTVLPRTRKEDADFRSRMQQQEIPWKLLWVKRDDENRVIDRISGCAEPVTVPEGYQLWWYHSTHKAELDLTARGNRIARAQLKLQQLQKKLRSPRSRHRERGKLEETVQEILKHYHVAECLRVTITEVQQEIVRQTRRGRPGKNTKYHKKVRTRLDLQYAIDGTAVALEQKTDGIFPLVTNDAKLSQEEVLLAYKRQPTIEKRFSQLKTDFAIAPVFLKDVGRIEALFHVYFIVLLVESLMERELRQAMKREGIEQLPMYPEGRPCSCPTARRLIDLFEPIQRYTLQQGDAEPTTHVTELSPLQKKILKLLGILSKNYGM